MKIKGIERGFALTVEATKELGKLCKDGDFRNFPQLFTGTMQEVMENDIRVAIIMNRAYEDMKAFMRPGYDPIYLTEEDFRFFQLPEIAELEAVLQAVINADQKVEIETEPIKEGKKTERRRTTRSNSTGRGSYSTEES